MSNNELFVIEYNEGVHGFYSDLDKAKVVLKKIYDEMHEYRDYPYFCFCIMCYKSVDGEFIYNDKKYRYYQDEFWEEKK